MAFLLFLGRPGSSLAQSCCADSNSTLSTYAGTGGYGSTGDGGPAILATFGGLYAGEYMDSNGNLYIGDLYKNVIRMVNAAGIISTFAGTGTGGYSGDGGPANLAELNGCQFITGDSGENIYITDSFNHRIRKVDPTGIITTFAGNGVSGYSGDGGRAALASLELSL